SASRTLSSGGRARALRESSSMRLDMAAPGGSTSLLRACESRQLACPLRDNVGVDRHAAALRRETYASAHVPRRNAAACPCRTTCYASPRYRPAAPRLEDRGAVLTFFDLLLA